MDCFRCGSTVLPGHRTCPECGQAFTTAARLGVRSSRISKLGRRFRLRRVLGEGPIGSVYAARDEERDTDVAVKIIRTEIASSEEEGEVFLRAMGRVNAIEHPNVAPVLECGLAGDRCYFVSPLLLGLPLRKLANLRRSRNERFLLEEVVPLVAQLVDGLEAGRLLGAHGDIKPENVILLPDHLVLTDFGLAQAIDADAFARAQRISPLARAYRAPELDAGVAPDVRSDVFSIGMLVAELLVGRPLLDSSREALGAIDQPDVAEVLARSLESDPEARFGTPEELLREIASVEAGLEPVESVTVRRRLLPETTQRITLDQIIAITGQERAEAVATYPEVVAQDTAAREAEDLEGAVQRAVAREAAAAEAAASDEAASAAHEPAPDAGAPPPREVTQQVSVDMVVSEPRSLPPPIPPRPTGQSSVPPAVPVVPAVPLVSPTEPAPPAPAATPVAAAAVVPAARAAPAAPTARTQPRDSQPAAVAGVAKASPSIPPGKVAAPRDTDRRGAVVPSRVLFDDSADKQLRPKDPTRPVDRQEPAEPADLVPRPRGTGSVWLLLVGALVAVLLLVGGYYWNQHREAQQREEVLRILQQAGTVAPATALGP